MSDPAIDVYRGLGAHLSAERGGERVELPDFRPE